MSVTTWNPSRSPNEAFVYIDLSAVDNVAKAISAATTVIGDEAPSRARQLVAAGDVLVSTVRPNLNAVAVVPPELDGATASTGFTVLRPADNLDGRYLFQWVRSQAFIADMVRNATGASYPAVSDRIVKGSMIPAPGLEEQRRIAAILDHADDLRAKRRRTLAHLDALTQSIFDDTLSSSDPLVPLGDALTFVTSGGRGWAKYYAQVGARFIQSLDVQMGTISDREPVFVTPPGNAEARRTRTQIGDVLLTITGSRIGRVSALPSGLSGSYVSQHVAILRANPKCLRPEYLATMLGLPGLGQRLIAKTQYGQTKPGLNFEQIRGFELPRPGLERQDIFLDRKSRVEGIRGRILAGDAQAKALFASLQSRAFRGEL